MQLKHDHQIQRYFDQQWLIVSKLYHEWNKDIILLWLRYKMKWFDEDNKCQQRQQFEIQKLVTKCNICGSNLNQLIDVLDNKTHWKRQIKQYIRALCQRHTSALKMTHTAQNLKILNK